MESYTDLLNNAILLLALGVIYDTLEIYKIQKPVVRDILSGLLVGLLGMAVMLTPWMLAPGIFFDTRWVLISLSGLFFGVIPTLIAVMMTVTLRLFQGGAGIYVGSLVIIVSAVIGLVWRKLEQERNWKLGWFNLYLLGLLVQVAVLSCMYFMPAEVRLKIVHALAPPLLTIFPIGSMILGMVLRRQRNRRETERELVENRKMLNRERGLLRSLIDSIPDVIFFKDTEDKYLGCNQAFEKLVGTTEQATIGKTDLELFSKETAEQFMRQDHQVIATGKPFNDDEWIQLPNGAQRRMSTHKAQFRGLDGTLYGLAGTSRDITERWLAEEERVKLQDQLSQAQKIESVGQLAGGIAHDFNNMLAVILGQAQLAKLRLDDKSRLKEAISEIQSAAERSSDLTKQLLAFARKQPTAPQVMDLSENIDGLVNMLRRIIGEDVELRLNLSDGLWKVKMDSGQLDQILTNLCVNARDAIDENGKITIDANNVILDEVWCGAHNCLQPGEYVVISVCDNGRGMDSKTRQKIFDPFFTTKPLGKGTGLGLATVYGIVSQNHGLIKVSSMPGHGSTFKIYLPRTEEATSVKQYISEQLPGGTETVLLVEDEEAVLHLTKEMLESLGYQVLPITNPKDVQQATDNYTQPIDLLLTDVIMPEINGRQLSKKLKQNYPELRTLFMSGYTADLIDHHGVLEEQIAFIEKPFLRDNLALQVRAAIEN